jgi:hypothetical protein
MAIAINKGKVPKDYTVCVLDKLYNSSTPITGTIFTALTTYTNASAMSSIPPYYMVGEIVLRRSTIIEDFSSSTSDLGWTVSIDNAIMNKFRFIRFIVDPLINYVAPEPSAGVAAPLVGYFVYFKFSITVNGTTYYLNKLIQSNLQAGHACTIPRCGYIFDTKTKRITEDTSNLFEIWSDI